MDIYIVSAFASSEVSWETIWFVLFFLMCILTWVTWRNQRNSCDNVDRVFIQNRKQINRSNCYHQIYIYHKLARHVFSPANITVSVDEFAYAAVWMSNWWQRPRSWIDLLPVVRVVGVLVGIIINLFRLDRWHPPMFFWNTHSQQVDIVQIGELRATTYGMSESIINETPIRRHVVFARRWGSTIMCFFA